MRKKRAAGPGQVLGSVLGLGLQPAQVCRNRNGVGRLGELRLVEAWDREVGLHFRRLFPTFGAGYDYGHGAARTRAGSMAQRKIA